MALSPEEEKLLDEQESSDMGPLDYLRDWARSAAAGPRRGLESIPGTAGDVYNIQNLLYSIISKATPAEQDALYNELDKQRLWPSSAETEAATEPYLGKHYEPKSRVGRILNLITASLTGGGGRHIFREAVAPAVGGEIGGEIGEATFGKGGRLFGTLLGAGGAGSGQEGVKRAVMSEATPERIENINILQNERTLPDAQGNTRPDPIELTGGQATGNKALQYAEVGPYAGKAEGIARQQAQQYTRAAMRRAGIDSDRADAATLANAQADFSNEYDQLIQHNNGIQMDQQLQQELINHGIRYEGLKGRGINDAVSDTFNRIVDASQQNGGVIPPAVFQQINGEISATLRAARNSPELAALSDTLREMRDSLYASMERGGAVSGVADQARDLNNRYRNFKIIEKSMRGQGQDVMYGFITPGNLASAVKQSESITDWAQSRGDFDDLAKAGGLTAPLPNSGTAGRGITAGVGTGVGAAGGLLLAGQPLAAMTALAGSVAAPAVPAIASSVLTSRPVRTSIVNRARGDAPNMWTPLPIQAASAPMWEFGSQGNMQPVPVETEPVVAPAAPAAAAPVVVPEPPAPVEAPPVAPAPVAPGGGFSLGGQRSELTGQDMPVPIDMAALLARPPLVRRA